jgi:hypothetical protein
MKNIFGTTEELKLKDKNGVLRYEYIEDYQYTYDSNGNQLTYEDSDGFWEKSTYDSNGNELTYEDSSGYKRGFDTKEKCQTRNTLQWIHDRIVNVYGESENVDFLIKMRDIIENL